jgi:hypothetical protein
MEIRGWLGFLAWAGLAAVVALAGVTAASIGVFLLPVVLGVSIAVGRRARAWPESLGALEGVAAVALVIGLANLGSSACPSNGELILKPGEHEASCGGLTPEPFLVAAVVIALIGLAGYRHARID